MGPTKRESEKIYKTFVASGGNFIDTANRYTEGTSEAYLGDFISAEREKIVLATKYTLHNKLNDVNAAGNHRKNMVQSLEASLKRLKTDYIDLCYLHAWDFLTPIEEVLRALDDFVRAGKILYIGISDTPAWIVSRANAIAELKNWTSFIGMQIEYSLIQRSAERELIPMANELDIAITAWATLGQGVLTGKYLENNSTGKRLKEGSTRLSDRNQIIAKEVLKVSEEIGCTASHVAINWVRQQKGVMIPVIGCRNESQLRESLSCLDYKLSAEHLERLDRVSKIEMGFPHDFLNTEGVKTVIYAGMKDSIDNHRKK
jgi:aryl-alcohol dehydrogenase-like predicted oxidoreductase